MTSITAEDRDFILSACINGRKVAAAYGTLHAWWDVIFDLEAYLKGERTFIQQTHEEWLAHARSISGEPDVRQDHPQPL